MFYLLAILSPIGYGLQMTLLGHLSRKMNALDMGFYRNASFLLTLSPLLFFASAAEVKAAFAFWPHLSALGFLAVLAVWGTFTAIRYLPIGIAESLKRAIGAILIFPLGYFFFDERLSLLALALILVAVGATVFLSLQKNHFPHLDRRAFLGVLVLALTSIPSALNFMLIAKLSRELNPWVAGYFWEAFIAMASALVLLGRYLIFKKKPEWIGWRRTGQIALAAWPTLLGTGAIVGATALGPVAIVSAIGLGSVVVATLVAHFFYHEKLTAYQWLGMAVAMAAIAGLKFVA